MLTVAECAQTLKTCQNLGTSEKCAKTGKSLQSAYFLCHVRSSRQGIKTLGSFKSFQKSSLSRFHSCCRLGKPNGFKESDLQNEIVWVPDAFRLMPANSVCTRQSIFTKQIKNRIKISLNVMKKPLTNYRYSNSDHSEHVLLDKWIFVLIQPLCI